jgi:hypothetical protein
MLPILFLLSIAAVLPAFAAEVRDCYWAASAQALAAPWEKNTRQFYRGEVRVALIDTGGEPVCCSAQLLILIPDNREPMGGRICKLVGDRDGMGFESIDMRSMTSRYEAGRGLLIAFPFRRYVDGIKFTPGVARVRVNVERGTVVAE